MTFVHDESWCWNPQVGGCPTNYTVTYAREFRYDGARARYLDRKLDPVFFKSGSLVELDATWTDYDGDEPYGDFTVSTANPPVVSNTDAYQPGLWNRIGGTSNYLHNDHLGTLRLTTGSTGSAGASRVFTAFGERLPGSGMDRFGFVGAWGYQDTLDAGAEVFPFLHVGARYYDPASGRFLQRDPIGIVGGLNVYQYAKSRATRLIDPSGLFTLGVGINFTLTLGCIHFQFELSVHLGLSTIDGHISLGGSATVGSGPAVGLGASGGLVGTLSGANDVGQLGGPAGEVGLDFGPISVGGIASPGTSDVPGYGAVQVGVGVGFGGGVRAGPTWTEVDPWY